MLFNSYGFLIFFPIVVVFYYIIPNKAKQIWLLIASYFFYMCWNAKYVLLLLFSTIITYVGGCLIYKVNSFSWNEIRRCRFKKIVVALGFMLNLAVLFYFKYCNFAIATLQRILRMIHIELVLPTFDIILPVGISFYTFQALGYIMDVYRGEIEAEKNFVQYALFVSFFPQLVAGPIERSKNLLKQLAVLNKFDYKRARDGFLLMLWGFFLKIVLADRIALFVDTVYAGYTTYPGWYLVVATMLFGIQIYCDFYGYSVIAKGAAEILGVQLMENFNAPYLSISVAEFWRKWHISLTSWFKDYLYIPLGGSRKGKFRKYLNKFIVFLISGLWHGASFSFVIWGGLNGVYQIIGELIHPVRDKLVVLFHFNREALSHKLLQMTGTFLLVDFSWIFFRATSFREAIDIIKYMCRLKNPWILFDGSLYKCGLDYKDFVLMVICIGILLFADYCKYRGIKVREIIVKQEWWFRELFVVATVCAILVFGIWGVQYDAQSFIYFQF